MTKEDQLSKSCGWFKFNVKCCYNCSNWGKDPTLMGDYAYNSCKHFFEIGNGVMTPWDDYCASYSGFAKENNLLHELTLDMLVKK